MMKRIERIVRRVDDATRGSLPRRIVEDLAGAELTDRSMTLAAQSFTSILPVMIAVSALGVGEGFDDTLIRIGIPVQSVSAPAGTAETTVSATSFGVVGVLMTIISATSYARALGRMYSRMWAVPTIALRAAWRWVAVIAVIVTGVTAMGLTSAIDLAHLTGSVHIAARLIIWFCVWSTIPFLLTNGLLDARVLAAIGGLTAIGLEALQIVSVLALPKIVASAQMQFGVLGAVFTLISWLFVTAAIVVACTTVVSSAARDEGTIGQWLRSGRPLPTTASLGNRPTRRDEHHR